MTSRIDLHMHSTASDGTDAPFWLAEKAKAAGIEVFAITDHDTVAGAEELLKNLREGKLNLRLDFLRDRGITFPEEETDALRRLPSAGKPHLGNLMVKYGYAASRAEAIRDVINLCPTGSSRISAETAVGAILASGGIPVWAHPLGGEGEKAVGPEQFGMMLDELSGYGILGLECFYSKYPLTDCERLAGIAQDRGLLVSGGSDYHGTNKAIAPGTLNADGHAIPPERITLLGALAERGGN